MAHIFKKDKCEGGGGHWEMKLSYCLRDDLYPPPSTYSSFPLKNLLISCTLFPDKKEAAKKDYADADMVKRSSHILGRGSNPATFHLVKEQMIK